MVKLPKSFLILSFGAAMGLMNCAARRPPLLTPPLIETAVETAATDRASAITMLESALRDNPDATTEPWLLLWAGEQRRLSGDDAAARSWFEQVADRYATHPLKEPAMLGMAVIDAGDSPSGNTLATLQLLGESGVPDSLNADRYRILARIAADEGSTSGRVRELVKKAVAYAESDDTVKIRVHATLGDLLSEEQTTNLTSVDLTAVTDSLGAQEQLQFQIKSAMTNDSFEDAIALARRYLELWPETERTSEMEYTIKRAEAGDVVQPGKVGVLLPMSGRYAPAATRFKQSIEMANRREGGPLELTFADTGGSTEQTIAELERLVLEEGCVALLGPLLKEGVMPAAEAAQALNVPMIALSQSQDPTAAGEYIYRGFLPLQQQVEALVEHAVTDRGFTRFAILYPENDYGQGARDIFTEVATARGATVVRRQSYDPGASVFLDAARQLGGKSKASGGSGEASNPPTIDYDALFIPDNHQRVALVASALAYEEFPVGTFRPGRVRGLPLLGLNAWNNPLLVESGGQYTQGSVFVDAFLSTSSDPHTAAFVSSYKAEYRREPSVIDAVTFDATRLLAQAVAASDGSRDSVRDSLGGIQLKDPVGAGSHFGADREVSRELLILTVTASGIRAWKSPNEGEAPQ
ncbi:MAG: penicillin-binding protein activator [Myxococcota bacterium]|nr:penicillin-binding protein activator [Myxococcota bacterium]